MKRELFPLYKIGRELGLNKKEIDKVFFYNNFKERNYEGIVIIIMLLFIGLLIFVSSLSIPPYVPKNNTYQTGTLYSTVKIKDFKAKK